MKKLLIIAIVLAIVSLPVLGLLPDKNPKTVFAFENRIGPERVTDFDPRVNVVQIDDYVYLEPTYDFQFEGVGRGGYAPMFPRAAGRVKSNVWNGFPESYVYFKTKDLPVSSRIGGMFEGWLVDDDTGYRMSMGAFTTVFGGVGQLRYRINNYLGAFDRIEVSVEPFDDFDVMPGPILLQGPITKDYSYTPGPKSSKMVTEIVEQI